MRSFLVSMPPDSTPSNVLIFLHGVGEAFIPLADADRQRLYSAQPGEHAKKPGVRNVFNHGIPMILSNPGEHAPHQFKYPARVPFVLPVFNDFVTIVPQMFLREDMAAGGAVEKMMDHALEFARSVVGNSPKVALMGFSRGGYAAFQLARRIEVKAIVTMDAAPREDDMSTFVKSINDQQKPFWAFFADYKNCDDDFEKRITNVHRELQVDDVGFTGDVPKVNKCKTLIPTAGTRVTKHNQVCDIVSGAHVVYEWILKALARPVDGHS